MPPCTEPPLGCCLRGWRGDGLLPGAKRLGSRAASDSPPPWAERAPSLGGLVPQTGWARSRGSGPVEAACTEHALLPGPSVMPVDGKGGCLEGGLGTCQENLWQRCFDGSEVPRKTASLSLRYPPGGRRCCASGQEGTCAKMLLSVQEEEEEEEEDPGNAGQPGKGEPGAEPGCREEPSWYDSRMPISGWAR